MPMGVRVRRKAALAMALVQVASLVMPVARALAFPTGTSREEYSADVHGRAALREDIEQRWQAARERRGDFVRQIAALREEQPPAGVDPTEWYRQRSRRIRELDRSQQENEESIQRYQERLGSLYEKLERDRRYIVESEDEGLEQSLGSLVGIAGAAAIPVMSRPMFGGGSSSAGNVRVISRGSIRGGGQVGTRPTRVPSGNAAASSNAGAAGTRAASAGTSGSSAAAGARASAGGAVGAGTNPARPNMWTTDIGKNGNILLRRGDRVVDTGRSSTLTQGRGRKASVVRNDAAWQQAESMRTMYGARDHLQTSINDLKGQLRRAPRGEARNHIRNQIRQLEGQQKQLNQDIKTTERPAAENQPGALRRVAGAAAKWALFSTALTVGMRAFDQLRENDWDVRSIDWSDAVAPLKTPEFWGGTAGSFGVSMLASAIVPGGALIKTAAAITGAAVGWQIGSGNLRHTDWAELGFSSAGSTIGVLLGSAIGGPIGAFLGGLAGHWLGTWLLGKVRNWLDDGSTAYSSDDRHIIDLDGDTTPYAGAAPPRVPDGPLPPGDAASIRARMNQIYSQIEALMEDPEAAPDARREVRELHAEYDQLHQQLRSLREAAAGG